MKNSIVILFALMFNVHKCLAQDTALINTFNTVISKADTGFSVDTTTRDTTNAIADVFISKAGKCFSMNTTSITNIVSLKIDSLNNLYFVKGSYIDTTDEDRKYGKIYVLKYDNYQFSIIDSTPRFTYEYYTLEFEVSKDYLFIHYKVKRASDDYTYLFNKRLQIYQLVSFSSIHYPSFGDEYTSNSNYDVKKQLLSWKITGEKDTGNKMYKQSGKKRVVLPKNFPIQLQRFKFDSEDYDLILSQWGK